VNLSGSFDRRDGPPDESRKSPKFKLPSCSWNNVTPNRGRAACGSTVAAETQAANSPAVERP
jgi:hypothetical protein